MKKNKLLLFTPFIFTLCSCTINDEGDFEFTWLFYALLIFFIIMLFIIGLSSHYDYQKEKKKGLTHNQIMEKLEKENKDNIKKHGLEIDYVGGYPLWDKPCKITFCIIDNDIVLKKGYSNFILKSEDIISISNERSGSRSLGKAAAGALVGGILTGGIGLVAGGLIGGKKKNTSEMFITYRYKENQLTLILRTGKNTDKIYAWINSTYI